MAGTQKNPGQQTARGFLCLLAFCVNDLGAGFSQRRVGDGVLPAMQQENGDSDSGGGKLSQEEIEIMAWRQIRAVHCPSSNSSQTHSSSLTTQLCVLIFQNTSTIIYTAHILLNVWTFTGAWSTSQWPQP